MLTTGISTSRVEPMNAVQPSSHRPLIKTILLVSSLFIAIGLSLYEPAEPIKIGALHSLTGTMASTEIYEVDTLRALVAATNRQGGILGRPVELIVADGASDPATFAQQAEFLLRDISVSVIFGCWLSSTRQAVIPLVERYNSLLMYPVQYEGLEQSKHVIYAGATPNQQLFPALIWAKQRFGHKLFLVGSDYVYPRRLNFIARTVAPMIGLEVIGERYLTLGDTDSTALAQAIALSGADFVINTINGDSNESFFKSMDRVYGANLDKPAPEVISLSLDENIAITLPNLQGHSYLSWSHFHIPEQRIPGDDPIISDALTHELAGRAISATMAATLINYSLWRKTVEHIGSYQPMAVNAGIRNQSTQWYLGRVVVDYETGHLYHFNQIAAHQNHLPLEIVWTSGSAIPPEPYPLGRSRTEWERALYEALGE